MAQPYLITFTPVGRFFFGGSKGFDDGFHVRSEQFPSQSTIVGALRASILYASGTLAQHRKRGRFILKKDRRKAVELAGTARTQELLGKDDNIGVIESISPVFLIQKNTSGDVENAYFPIPVDISVNNEENNCRISGFIHKKGKTSNCGRKTDSVLFSDHNPKNEGRRDILGGKQFWKAYFENTADLDDTLDTCGKNSPFVEHRQVGIGLERKKTIEGMYYVKNDYSFSRSTRNFGFGVICFLTEDTDFTRSIILGGEKSVFMINKQVLSEAANLNDHPLIKILGKFKIQDNSIENGNDDGRDGYSNGRCKFIALSPVVSNNSGWIKPSYHAIVQKISSLRMIDSVKLKHAKSSGYVKGNGKTEAYRVLPSASVMYVGQDCDTLKAPYIPLASKTGLNQLIKIPQ